MEAFLAALMVKAPALVVIPWVMGVLRAILKPTFSWIHQILGAVGATKLDADVTVIEQSTAMKWFTYVLDWFASVKLAKPSVIVSAPVVVGLAPVQEKK